MMSLQVTCRRLTVTLSTGYAIISHEYLKGEVKEEGHVHLTNSIVPEPEGSSLHSQQPSTGPYHEPTESTPYPQANFPKIHYDPILTSMLWSSKWSLSFRPSMHATFSLL
jgi:hypothetical protein